MKTLTLLGALCSILILSTHAHAAPQVLTVDNNPGAVAMFSTFEDAYVAAEPGDTILLAGSPDSYDAVAIYKRLNIVGPGYLLTQNGFSGIPGGTAYVYLNFEKSDTLGNSSGSTVTGVTGSLSTAEGTFTSIDRCLFSGDAIYGRISVKRSYINGLTTSQWSNGSLIKDSIINYLSIEGENCIVTNCVIKSNFWATSSSTASSNLIITSSSSTPSSFASEYKGSITHSMAVGASFLPEGGGNINDQDVLEVFIANGSDDSWWRLKAGSPAIGAGFNGVDMGAFGGSNPYVLSGLPSRPRLTRFVVPATATDASGLQFEVDAQAH